MLWFLGLGLVGAARQSRDWWHPDFFQSLSDDRFSSRFQFAPGRGSNVPLKSATQSWLKERSAAKQDVLLSFGAGWCGPCRNHKIELQRLKAYLHQTAPLIAWADEETDPYLITEWGVELLPSTFYLAFNSSSPDLYEYLGPSDSLSLYAWLKRVGKDSETDGSYSDLEITDAGELADILRFSSSLYIAHGCSSDEWANDVTRPQDVVLIHVPASVNVTDVIIQAHDSLSSTAQKDLGGGGCLFYHRPAAGKPFETFRLLEPPASTYEWIANLRSREQPLRLNNENSRQLFASRDPVILAVWPNNVTRESRAAGLQSMRIMSDHLRRLRSQSFAPLQQEGSGSVVSTPGLFNSRESGMRSLSDAEYGQGNAPYLVAEMGSETVFERRVMDWLGISSAVYDLSMAGMLNFGPTSPLILLIQPSQQISLDLLPRTHQARLPVLQRPSIFDAHVLWVAPLGMFYDKGGRLIPQRVAEWVENTFSGTSRPTILRSAASRLKERQVSATTALNALELRNLTGQMDMVLFVHEAWCTHCMKVEPLFKKVAQRNAASPILFATFDVEANAFPPIFAHEKMSNVSRFVSLPLLATPTILLYRKGSTVPSYYAGERTTGALELYLREFFKP